MEKSHRDKIAKTIKRGAEHPFWKGENVGIKVLHKWIKTKLLKPKNCQVCGEEKKLDLANISQKYRRDISDWEWLCRRCHMLKDGRLERLKLTQFRSVILTK